jgi:hypothetical protein
MNLSAKIRGIRGIILRFCANSIPASRGIITS